MESLRQTLETRKLEALETQERKSVNLVEYGGGEYPEPLKNYLDVSVFPKPIPQ